MPIDTAIILAGGKGERLRPLTDDRHKGMIDMGGKPMHPQSSRPKPDCLS